MKNLRYSKSYKIHLNAFYFLNKNQDKNNTYIKSLDKMMGISTKFVLVIVLMIVIVSSQIHYHSKQQIE